MKELRKFSKNLKVLMVEDNEESREQITKLLQNFFDDVTVAVDGINGLKKFNANAFDLIISDINMPNMNGIKMVSEIREINKEIPVVFLSAHNDEGYFMDAIKLGINGYVLKPIDLTQFMGTVSDVIENIKLKTQNLEYKKELEAINENLEQRVKEAVLKNKEQNQHLMVQSRLAQMGEMISMIAHQWRQPLGAISSTAGNLEAKIDFETFDLDTKEGQVEQNIYFRERLKKIGGFVANLTATIDDFKNFYKLDKKSVRTNFEEIIKKAMAIVESSFANDNIELIYNYNSNEKMDIYDREMMQVVLNILKNAQDNFKEKQTTNLKITITTDKKSLSICDNGGGIPENILEKIFDPYFSTKDEKNGTGLGLYMSKTIIEEHHKGNLNALNTGDGVCFTINLDNNEEAK